MAEEVVRFDYVFKVVLVGERGVGKSALACRFVSDVFVPDIQATIGVDYRIRVLRRHGKVIKVSLWDTSGQEAMRSIVPNYFRFSDAVVTVFDTTDVTSFQLLADWLTLALEYTDPGTLRLIVATKSDLEAQRVVPAETATRFAASMNVPLIETSALLGTNVETGFLKLVDAMLKKAEAEAAAAAAAELAAAQRALRPFRLRVIECANNRCCTE